MRQNITGHTIIREDKIVQELEQSIVKKFKIMIAEILVLTVLLIIIFVYML